MPGMLGWFKMTPSTTIEDITWLMTRSAAYNAGFAFVTDLKTLEANGMTDEIFSILNVWESARLEGKFSKDLMVRMSDLSTEFKLERKDPDIMILTQIFSHRFLHESKTRQPGEPLYSTFSFDNNSHEQYLSFIISAQNADISNIVLEINSHRTIKLPVNLKKGQTVKFMNQKTAILYDENWNEISSIPLDKAQFKLSKGQQSVTFDCSFSNTFDKAHAKIEFVLNGLAETIK